MSLRRFDPAAGATMIDALGAGGFRIAGAVRRGPVLVRAERAADWGGPADAAGLIGFAQGLEIVFLGMGADFAPVPADLGRALQAAGLRFEAMSTRSAARSYNELLSEGRRVCAALLPLPETGAGAGG
ncbi:Mth938-like domain-containing protein [Phaeovulum vinaykumarii]|uniref:Uncharacterized conserved protein, contains Mth938-like domain n=1 Tax=Phaeovulum vinaykumarii TaxID=407234 RepID=A0A1N7M2U4_9RHOB|nr:Mth938-like domain-containing protein [Phaeovulum vinaykumarii]SIS80407.1 Uncharacterized conserved protein, contains Mth938-like domain [Phaeovulum vinaykumarii]SOC09234.1 uncharacterized protein SAMN05878426_10588 [Phaeovulum vinaykumarii]